MGSYADFSDPDENDDALKKSNDHGEKGQQEDFIVPERGKTILSENTSLERRVSPRLRNIKRVYYGNDPKEIPVSENKPPKKTRISGKKDGNIVACMKDNVVEHSINEGMDSIENVHLEEVKEKETLSEIDSLKGGLKSHYARVMETLRIFHKHYLHFVQEEEQRFKKVENTQHMSQKSKIGLTCREEVKRASKRPDLKATSKMMEIKAVLYPQKRIGHLPGIEVGHQFFSRAEMVAVGLHSHWLNGIDFMGTSYSKLEEYKDYSFPLAICVVLSGQYEDDLDSSEDVVYTGQGGNDLLGNKRQIRDQVMRSGNLALKNSMENKVPVRVIRGHISMNSYCGKVYTYDGLYKVVDYWAEKGVSGFTVFKYRMHRLDGQPILTTNQVHFTRGQVPASIFEARGLVCNDISGGQENIPIPATNVLDDPPFAPSDFVYSKSIQLSETLKLPSNAPGCNCKEECINSNYCSCAKLNGSDFPYVHKNGGRLIEAKNVVFECGPNCSCGPKCVNRISQQGLKYQLEVFRSPSKGWAVRSWDYIPSGAPICEYTGVLKRTDELDHVSENNFIFEIDCLQTMKGLEGRERRMGNVSIDLDNHIDAMGNKMEHVPEFCIDADQIGNVARFINHSCQPNLFVQCILSSHHDIKLARVMLFAADSIPPLQELTYDYGYALDSVIGPDGKIKKMPCYCGASDCRKRLY